MRNQSNPQQNHTASRRAFLHQAVAGTGLGLAVRSWPLALVAPLPVHAQGLKAERAKPRGIDRPIVPADALLDEASFIDPTAQLTNTARITPGQRVYVGPFASLDASRGAIAIGAESNVQDNVVIRGGEYRRRAEREALKRLGLGLEDGVETGERCILAHGCQVIGPALIGIGGFDADPVHDFGAFLSFGSEVDGAILEQKCAVSALARVGPGVRLRSGFVVLAGKNVETQAQADDPSLGKVRVVAPGDLMFKDAVVEVNTSLAREYSRLYRDDPTAVTGINLDPGGSSFNPARDTPLLAGEPTRRPRFRNRVIGAVTLADSFDQLDHSMGRAIAIRADEGEPIAIGHIADMDDHVTFHALEETAISIGHGVRFRSHCIVHGGARSVAGVAVEHETAVEDNVDIGQGAVVFRSRVGRGSRIGARSAVINSVLPADSDVPDGVIIQDNVLFGSVEWERR
jgi:carbonic anhydrase/acetyltransferase-like protein (isoleucine patch superfamily)